jgi:hypothetical protein
MAASVSADCSASESAPLSASGRRHSGRHHCQRWRISRCHRALVVGFPPEPARGFGAVASQRTLKLNAIILFLSNVLDYRVSAKTLAGKDGDDLVWAAITPAYGAVNIYDGPDALDETTRPLTRGQLALLSIRLCAAEVCNGGFDQFFSNSTGILAAEAAEGMALIGAENYRRLLRRAMDVFPSGVVPLDRNDRLRALASAIGADTRFRPLEEEFYAGLEGLYSTAAAYVRANPADFILPSDAEPFHER